MIGKGACDLQIAGPFPYRIVDPSQVPMLPCGHVHFIRIEKI